MNVCMNVCMYECMYVVSDTKPDVFIVWSLFKGLCTILTLQERKILAYSWEFCASVRYCLQLVRPSCIL